MKRYYFIGDDLNDRRHSRTGADRQGRRRGTDSRAESRRCRRRTAPAARCAVADEARRHPLRRNRRADWTGASIAAIAIAQVTGVAAKVGWVPFVFLAIVLLGFFTWEGGLIGIQLPNSRFRRFEKALRAGEHVFFVDVDARRRRHVAAGHGGARSCVPRARDRRRRDGWSGCSRTRASSRNGRRDTDLHSTTTR